ncbi:MAG TPA: superoxide dismutase [Ohtaekwangia sp.]|nr:superoxide dismutase [Ohtaekwangia sp.]
MKTTRRKFIETGFKATFIAGITSPLIVKAALPADVTRDGANMVTFEFKQLPLPYQYNALDPHIDEKTMEIHYTKHHASYVKKINDAIAAEKISVKDEKDFFKRISKLSSNARNNGGGAWNHNFFWQIMKPNAGGAPTGKIGEAITSTFGSFEKFKEQFTQAGMTRFGSGWAWLVSDNGKLKIGSTPNQDNPLMDVAEFKGTPLLGLDVWEHAYYLKYQNKRNEYIQNWWSVVNWDEVAKRLG